MCLFFRSSDGASKHLDGLSSDPDESPRPLHPWDDSPLCDGRLANPHDSISPALQVAPCEGCSSQPEHTQPLVDLNRLTGCASIRTERTVSSGGDIVCLEVREEEEERVREEEELDDPVQDTVGVVVLDRLGNVASSVSSGGIGKLSISIFPTFTGTGTVCNGENTLYLLLSLLRIPTDSHYEKPPGSAWKSCGSGAGLFLRA